MKRYGIIMLLFAMLCSFAACGNTATEEERTENTAGPEATSASALSAQASAGNENTGEIYERELISVPKPGANLLYAVRSGESIFMYGMLNGEEWLLYKMDIESRTIERIDFPQNHILYRMSAGLDGGICVLCINEEGEYILLTLNNDGAWMEQTLPTLEEYENSVITQIYPMEKGYIVFTVEEILALDTEGKLVKKIARYYRMGACMTQKDGSILIAAQVMAKPGDQLPVTRTLVLDQNFNITASYDSNSRFVAFFDDPASEENSYLAYQTNILYRFNYKNDTKEAIIDIFSSSMSYTSLIPLGAELYFSLTSSGPALWRPLEGDAPVQLSLATYHLSFPLQLQIAAYNESNAKYKINVIDYAMYDEAGAEEQGLTRLRMDIISGNGPDLYELSQLPAELYASKGLFEDLKPYFAENSPIQYADFVQNAVDALEYNGGLYYITPWFELVTIGGRRACVGTKGSWTVDEFLEAVKDYSPADVFGPSMTKNSFLMYLLIFSGKEYIDEDTLQCRFNDGDFEKLLTFASGLPDEYDPNKSTGPDLARAYIGLQPLLVCWVRDQVFMGYNATALGEEPEYVGFPALHASGVAMSPQAPIAVSVSTGKKDAAMDFIYFLLGDSVQRSLAGNWPIVQSYLDERLDYWEEEFFSCGETNILATSYEGVMMEIVSPVNEETANLRRAEILDIIDRIDCITLYDDTRLDILIRECQPFFSGDISAHQAAERVQSKMQVYVSEQYG